MNAGQRYHNSVRARRLEEAINLLRQQARKAAVAGDNILAECFLEMADKAKRLAIEEGYRVEVGTIKTAVKP